MGTRNPPHNDTLPRRHFLKVLGIGAASTAACAGTVEPQRPTVPTAAAATAQPEPNAAAPTPAAAPAAAVIEPPLILNATEYAFVEAAVDTLIPADELSPSGSECGVAVFIDRQLAGAFGAGARLYRSGPFQSGKPEHGYQLSLTPLELFKAGVNAVHTWCLSEQHKPFDALAEPERSAILQKLEHGAGPVSFGAAFFELLLALTMEGFFADPLYGGNRDKAGWKMLGYPGLPATYERDIVQYHGKRYDREPQAILDFS